MIRTKRHTYSTAYIDSTLVVAFIAGLVAFAVWIAWQTAGVINPWWLGGSIIAIGLYQMIIFWLMRQYWDVHRIFIIFALNIVCLGLILALVGFVFDVQLPVDLPILNTTLYLAGIEATSYSPGSVAISYTVVGLFCGYFVMIAAMFVENTRWAKKVKKWLRLDRLDLAIDTKLDDGAFAVENTWYVWLITPIVLLVLLNIVVVGSASLI